MRLPRDEVGQDTEMGMTVDEASIRDLYIDLLRAWNSADATAFVAGFRDDGEVIGFDGSILTGSGEIEAELRRIFADHRTGSYVGIIDGVSALTPDVALLRATAGVIPADASNAVTVWVFIKTLSIRRQIHIQDSRLRYRRQCR